MLSGLLIKESLQQPELLETLPVRITKIETWAATEPAKFQPTIWTAMTFAAEDGVADKVAEQFSCNLKSQGWFINASTETTVYVMFCNKVFKYAKGDREARAEAVRFGQAAGIPDRQLDWDE